MDVKIVNVDFNNKNQCDDLVYLLNDYALDPMGGGEVLSNKVKENLAEGLHKFPTAFSLICYVDGEPAGLVNAIMGFSTFKCMPLINIHDLTVVKKFRGLSLSQRLLDEVEIIAKAKQCCKVTLEVLEGNEIAKNAYAKFGFSGYELDPNAGKAMLWQKLIS